jgi:hypothetical protein
MIVMVNQFLSQLPELFTRRKEDASNVIAAMIFDSKVFVPFILIITAIGFTLFYGVQNFMGYRKSNCRNAMPLFVWP